MSPRITLEEYKVNKNIELEYNDVNLSHLNIDSTRMNLQTHGVADVE